VNTVRAFGRIWKSIAAMLVGIAVLGASPLAAARQEGSAASPEYMIKAAYLLNFARLIEWPRDAFATADSPVTIGIIGDDPFGSALDLTVEGKRISNRRIAIQRLQWNQDLRRCHILFMSASESLRIGELASRVAGLPILIVGDTSRLATRGATINFTIEDDRVRFEVNVDAARRARLNVSSQILRVAKIVRERS
jgi:YfiR/HmsC-like